MRCVDIQELMDEYQDGELESELAAGIQLHLGGCRECSEILAALKAERKLYQDYRRAVERTLEVPPAIWAGVCAEIESSGRSADFAAARAAGGRFSIRKLAFFISAPWFRQLSFAAILIVLSVAATLFVVHRQGSQSQNLITRQPSRIMGTDPGGPNEPVAQVLSDFPEASSEKSLEAAMRAIQGAEKEYLEAIRVLSTIVDNRKATFQPAFVQEMERNFRAIDKSIEATRKAYYAHPSDPYLAEYMLAAYSKKVELLQELSS